MDRYLIYTDAAADIPTYVFEEDDLRVVPMTYFLDGREIRFDTGSRDHDSICDEFFAALKNGVDAKTTQINPYNFTEIWAPELKSGHDILYLSFSSGLSGSYYNACSAAEILKEEYPDRKIVVFDTRAATMGQGIIVRAAVLNRKQGMSIEENESWLLEHRENLCHRFMVGDLNHLHKGGRLSAAAAVVGGMLKIKPILIIDDEGKLHVSAKARGLKMATKRLIEDYLHEQGVSDVPPIIHIGHTSLYEQAEELKEEVKKVVPEGMIIDIVNMGPIIGAHVGPELLAVCGWGFHRLAEK